MASEAQQPSKQAPAAKPRAASPLKQLLIKPKPCAVILLLKDAEQSWYPSKLARTSGSSYVHVINLLTELRRFEIVASEKKGKQNIFHLTEKGAYLALTLDDLVKKCDTAEAEHKMVKQEAPPAHPLPEAAAAQKDKAEHKEKPDAKPAPAEKK